jgi:hypothetical protein
MYYPYFRGKQFELITIREAAELMARADMTVVVYGRPVLRKTCKFCAQPILLMRVAATGRWATFDRGARILDTEYETVRGGVRPLQTFDQRARHECHQAAQPAATTPAPGPRRSPRRAQASVVAQPPVSGTVAQAELHFAGVRRARGLR